jgi:hypothetical protein
MNPLLYIPQILGVSVWVGTVKKTKFFPRPGVNGTVTPVQPIVVIKSGSTSGRRCRHTDECVSEEKKLSFKL